MASCRAEACNCVYIPLNPRGTLRCMSVCAYVYGMFVYICVHVYIYPYNIYRYIQYIHRYMSTCTHDIGTYTYIIYTRQRYKLQTYFHQRTRERVGTHARTSPGPGKRVLTFSQTSWNTGLKRYVKPFISSGFPNCIAPPALQPFDIIYNTRAFV